MPTKRCVRCLLPGNYPGVQFNEGRVCSYCLGRQHFGVEADPQDTFPDGPKEKLRVRILNGRRSRPVAGPSTTALSRSAAARTARILAQLLKNEYGSRS
jgi:hypothetical protein